MRYCVNCGKPLESSRFCTHCGADNGNEVNAIENNTNGKISVNLNGISLPMILNWVSILLFAIVAYTMLRMGVNQLKNLSVASILYQGVIIPSIIYFILCVWISVPALNSILNANENQSKKIVSFSIITIVIMVVACILNAIFKNASGRLEIVSMCLSIYTLGSVKVIILSALAAGAAIFGTHLNQGVK